LFPLAKKGKRGLSQSTLEERKGGYPEHCRTKEKNTVPFQSISFTAEGKRGSSPSSTAKPAEKRGKGGMPNYSDRKGTLGLFIGGGVGKDKLSYVKERV